MATNNLEKYEALAKGVETMKVAIQNRDLSKAETFLEHAKTICDLLIAANAEDGNTERATEAILNTGVIELVDVFLEAYAWKCDEAKNMSDAVEDDKGQRVLVSYMSTLFSLYFATERFAVFCERATEKGVIEAITDELATPEMLKQRCEPVDEFYSSIALFYVKTLTNITARTPTAVEKFNQDRKNLLKKYLEGDNYLLTTMALFALSSVTTDTDKYSISSQLADAIQTLLKSILNEYNPNPKSSEIRITATELLESLCQVANCSDNFVTKMVQAGLLDVLDAILTAPPPPVDTKTDRFVHTPPSDPNKLVDYTNDIEKLLTIKLIWMAKFTEDVRKVLLARASTLQALQQLAQNSANSEVKSQAKNLLNSLQASPKTETHSANSAKLLSKRQQLVQPAVQQKQTEKEKKDNVVKTKNVYDRIFVSYSHKQQQLVFSVVDKLRSAGLRNVVTDLTIESDWYTWMVEQVEQADIVLVCFSKAYYESGNCKDEAMNARALGKIIIPCKMEDYNPISWLGGITRVRLWRDYSNPSAFEDSVSKLIEEIKGYISAPSKFVGTPTAHAAANLTREHSAVATVVTDSTKAATSKTVESGADQLARVNLWDEEKTKQFLASIGYPAAEVQPGTLNGKFVTGLMLFARKAPDALCEQLLKQKGINFDKAILIVGELAAGPSK